MELVFIVASSFDFKLLAQKRDSISFYQSFSGPDIKTSWRLNLGSPPIFIRPQNFLIPSFSFRRTERSFQVNSLSYPFNIYETSIGITSINKFDHGFSITLIPIVSLHSTGVSELFSSSGLGFLLISSIGYQVSDLLEISIALVYSRSLNQHQFLPGGSLRYRSEDSKFSVELGYPRSRVAYFPNQKLELGAQFSIESLSSHVSDKAFIQTEPTLYSISSKQMHLGPFLGWNLYKRLWLTGGVAWIFYDKMTGLNKAGETILSSAHPKDHIIGHSSISIRF